MLCQHIRSLLAPHSSRDSSQRTYKRSTSSLRSTKRELLRHRDLEFLLKIFHIGEDLFVASDLGPTARRRRNRGAS